MKAIFVSVMLMLSVNAASCSPGSEAPPTAETTEENGNTNGENGGNEQEGIEDMKLKMTVGSRTLTATFTDNPTARDFIELLPMTVKLDDYASTEKIFYPSRRLSIEGAPSGIDPAPGDITYYSPWGNVAIFYKDFGYSGGLVRIATIDGGLDALQVSGSIENVKFELIETDG